MEEIKTTFNVDSFWLEGSLPNDYYKEPDIGEGPWTHEPDEVFYLYNGFPCVIRRNALGVLCGYIGLCLGHSQFAQHYDDVEGCDPHGGFTFSELRIAFNPVIPQLKEFDRQNVLWWLGFDCSHYMDVVPTFASIQGLHSFDRTYKDINYVNNELHRMTCLLCEENPWPKKIFYSIVGLYRLALWTTAQLVLLIASKVGIAFSKLPSWVRRRW